VLDPAYAFTLSQVLQDEDSEYFITGDEKMLYNDNIASHEQEVDEQGSTILGYVNTNIRTFERSLLAFPASHGSSHRTARCRS
jgi:hypothetical protein